MFGVNVMSDPTIKQMYAKAVGELVLNYVESVCALPEPETINHQAVRLIVKIKEILDDDTLDDPDCFRRIETIVELYHKAGIGTARHDWG